jgi:hypothetical protein
MRRSPAWTVLLLAACAGEQDLPVVPPPPPPPSQTFRLEASPNGQDSFAMGIGVILQLAPRLISSTGDTLFVPGWISYVSRTPSVLSAGASGLLTALTPGSARVVVSTEHQGKTLVDSLAVQVFCTVEIRAVVNPAVIPLLTGDRFTPTLSLTTCGGQVTMTNTIVWSADDPTVVSVNPVTGETLALSRGETVVRAYALGLGPPGGLPVAGIDVEVSR